MKANYKNWIPKGMLWSILVGSVLASVVMVYVLTMTENIWLEVLFVTVFVVSLIALAWCIYAYNAFDYNGNIRLSKKIIDGIVDYTEIPDGGNGLDVGCGSGALTIACAKKNPNAIMTGIDRWGKEYASFNKQLCENNAIAENTSNIIFMNGNAIKLDFEDETFDLVTSNYVYHNIGGHNKQELLNETLRVLKKGGTFAIHDIMSYRRYGDMKKYINQLENNGFCDVELIDTTKGKFMSYKMASLIGLKGSTLLVGKKSI